MSDSGNIFGLNKDNYSKTHLRIGARGAPYSESTPFREIEGVMTEWVRRLHDNMNGNLSANSSAPLKIKVALDGAVLPVESRNALFRMMSDFVDNTSDELWRTSVGSTTAISRLEIMIGSFSKSITAADWSVDDPVALDLLRVCEKIQGVPGLPVRQSAGAVAIGFLKSEHPIPAPTYGQIVELVVAELQNSEQPRLANQCADAVRRATWLNFHTKGGSRVVLNEIQNTPMELALSYGDGFMAEALIQFWFDNEKYDAHMIDQALMQLHDCMSEERTTSLLLRWPELRVIDGFNQSWDRHLLRQAADDEGNGLMVGPKRSL